MKKQDFSTRIAVSQTTAEVFNAVINVRGWWSENVEGRTDVLNAEFLYWYQDVHSSKMRIIEFIPGKKVVWLVLENQFSFTKDKNEWKGNRIVFEIFEKGSLTELIFTHEGLVPDYECYDVCEDAWTSYIRGSLKSLITAGTGMPNSKEGGLNADLIEKWGLPDIRSASDVKAPDYTFSFETGKSAKEIFDRLLRVEDWWSGLFGEKIDGASRKRGDEFTFAAGDGAHYSVQRLIELVPSQRIVWQVVESNLTFLQKPSEWTDTKICFEISTREGVTHITFTHVGLVVDFECYDTCSDAWTRYLEKFAKKVGKPTIVAG